MGNGGLSLIHPLVSFIHITACFNVDCLNISQITTFRLIANILTLVFNNVINSLAHLCFFCDVHLTWDILQEMQNDLDREAASLQELEAQKQDAQDRLEEMDQQKHKLEDMLNEVRLKCQEESQMVRKKWRGAIMADFYTHETVKI